MLCLYPSGIRNFPCGQCMNCRINNKRVWTSRILLEALFYRCSLFVTLTYSDQENSWLPITETGRPTLNPEHLKRFIRRLRKKTKHISPVRYFGVGEYGEKTERPHYHIMLFGAGPEFEPFIHKAWRDSDGEPLGFVTVGLFNADRAAYIAGYTTKKMTQPGDRRLGDRYPEFARMSTKGLNRGLGYCAVGWLADVMGESHGLRQMKRYGDVWSTVRIDGKIYPLGRYIRRGLREALGLSHDAEERARQLGDVDPSTGEIKPAEFEPLPEEYGPWRDMMDTPSLPLVQARQDAETKEKRIEAFLKAGKAARRGRSASLTRQV